MTFTAKAHRSRTKHSEASEPKGRRTSSSRRAGGAFRAGGVVSRAAGNQAIQRAARGRDARASAPASSASPRLGSVRGAPAFTSASAPRVQRCGCGGGSAAPAEVLLQRQARGSSTPAPTRVRVPTGGAPLDRGTRRGMERGFGRDLGGVRVHTGREAGEAANRLNARAFTVGQDVVFANGEYSPGTREGRRLLAHELTHTVQQSGARPSAQAALRVSRPGDALEREADRVAARVVDGGAGIAPPVRTGAPRIVASQPRPGGASPRPGEGGAVEETTAGDLFFDDLYREIEEIEEIDQCDDDAFALRGRLLITLSGRPPPTGAIEAERYRDWFYRTAASEDRTLDALPRRAVDVFPVAFPRVWGDWTYDALAFEADLVLAHLEETFSRYGVLLELRRALPDRLWEHGLPLTYDEVAAVDRFVLSLAHADRPGGGPVAEFAAAGRRYTGVLWRFSFVHAWNGIAHEIADAVRECVRTPDVAGYYDFLDNYAEILGSLPERLAAAHDEDGLLAVEGETLRLVDAALLTGAVAGLFALGGILAGYHTAREMFDAALAEANGHVAGAENGQRFLHALEWAYEHGYYREAAARVLAAIREHGVTIVVTALGLITGALVLAQFAPGLNVALDAALLIYGGIDLLRAIDAMAEAVSDTFAATTILRLQKESAELALVLLSDGATTLIDVILFLVSLRGARVRASEISGANPRVSTAEAMRHALGESDDVGRALAEASLSDGLSSAARRLTREERSMLSRNPDLLDVSDATFDLYRRRPELVRALADHPRAARFVKRCSSPCFPEHMTADHLDRLDAILERGEGLRIDADSVLDALHGTTDGTGITRVLDALERDVDLLTGPPHLRTGGVTGDEGLSTTARPPAGTTGGSTPRQRESIRENEIVGDVTEARHNVELGGAPGHGRDILGRRTYDEWAGRLARGEISLSEFAAAFPHGAEQVHIRVLDPQTGALTTRIVDRLYHEGGRVVLRESKGVADLPLDRVGSHLRTQVDRDLAIARRHPGEAVIEWRIDATAITEEQRRILRLLVDENDGVFRVSPSSLIE